MFCTDGHHDQINDLYRDLDAADTTNAVAVILKVRGETCDVDCLYCYEKRKEAPGGARISAGQIRQLAELFRGRALAVELHGGEPLTAGRGHLAEILAELAAQPSVVRISLQTNGVALDGAWLDLFDEIYPGLKIGISLDGDARGNAWRVGYDGKPIYERVTAALRLLTERGRSTGVIAAVTPAILGRAEAVLDHLASFGAINAISFVPCFDTSIQRPTAASGRRIPASRVRQRAELGPTSGPAWAIRPDDYAEFVLAATAHWIGAGYSARMKLEPAVSAIRRLRGLDTGFCHFSDLKCDHVFTLYPDGRLGSCDELPWPQAQLISLAQPKSPQPPGDRAPDQRQVIAAQQQSGLLNEGRALMDRCVTCDYRTTCGGGCVATRWRYDQSGDQDAYCDYRMRMIDGIAALLAQPGDPTGAQCRTLRSRPRHPNTMANVSAFLARWNDPDAPRATARLSTSTHGNINTVGLPGTHEAEDLDPKHPQWAAAIEPGARALVDVVTEQWDLVTYDSCEGHSYPGLDLPAVPRGVGVLPRDRAEYARAAAALCRAVTSCTSQLPTSVQVSVGRCELSCETTGHTLPALDVRLYPAQDEDWVAYCGALDDATTVLVSAMRDQRPSDNVNCGCPGQVIP